VAKSTNTTPLPPKTKPKFWPEPQRTLPQPPPYQPSTNKPPVPPLPTGGGGSI